MPSDLLSQVHPDRSPDHRSRNVPRIPHVGVTRVEAHNILAEPEHSEEGRGDGNDEPKQDRACRELKEALVRITGGGGGVGKTTVHRILLGAPIMSQLRL
jgi:hypothetical protein